MIILFVFWMKIVLFIELYDILRIKLFELLKDFFLLISNFDDLNKNEIDKLFEKLFSF